MPSRAAAAALLLACGCAGLPAGRPPRGGGPWRQLATEHFVVRTDLEPAPSAELVEQLETMRAAVLAALPVEVRDPPGRIEVVAFREREEYQAFAPAHATAYYLRSAAGPPRLVIPGGLGTWQRIVLAHELTHHLLSSLLPHQPRWLSEGLASWMEGIAEVPLGPTMTVDRLPVQRLPRPRQRRIPVAELLAWGEGPVEWDWLDHYAGALVLVRHLYDRHPAAFGDYLARLARGERPEPAFRAAFPAFDPRRPGALEALDAEVQARVASGVSFPARQLRVQASSVFVAQPLPLAEVAALRISLWNQGPPKSPGALRAEAREGLRHAPAHPVHLQVLAELDGSDPLAAARTAVAAHPDDPRAWTFLAGALPAGAPEREEAHRRAAVLAPENAAVLLQLARYLLAGHRSGEALPYARRAARLAPWSPPVLEGYAAVLADLGQCREALDLQRRAIELLSERDAEPERIPLRRRLEEMERGCAPPGEERPGAQGSRTDSP